MKLIFSFLGFAGTGITIWETAMGLNNLSVLSLFFLIVCALFCAAVSYRLYKACEKERTEIVVGAIMINIALIGFILIACVNMALISPDPYSYRMPSWLYITAWVLFSVGGVCSVSICEANQDEANNLILKAAGLGKH